VDAAEARGGGTTVEGAVRILLIDDEPAVTRMVARGLTLSGFEVLVAETGEDGLGLLASEPVDLVLLDIMLPGKDGLEVLDEIRLRQSDLPVIMLTARGDPSTRAAALAAGANDYITKPFTFRELQSRVRALIQRGEHR
jgi:DNA-binding response OmpR family regulator